MNKEGIPFAEIKTVTDTQITAVLKEYEGGKLDVKVKIKVTTFISQKQCLKLD